MSDIPTFETLIGEQVVLDLSSRFVCVGRLRDRQGDHLLLQDVDIHDLRDTQTSREKYVLDCRDHGVNPNRRWAWVSAHEVVSVSRLEDVMTY